MIDKCDIPRSERTPPFEPLHIILGGVLHADFLIAAVHDRHEVLPP